MQNTRIITFYNIYNKVYRKVCKYYKAKCFSKLPWYIQLMTKAYCFIKTIGKPFTDYYAVDAISRKTIRKLIDNDYDAIVSHSHPFASHLLASDLMRYQIAKKWIAVLWDPFVYNHMDPSIEIPKRKKAAEKILQKASSIYILDGIMPCNYANGWIPSYNARIKEMHLPTLVDKCNHAYLNNNATIVTYAGNFYSEIREPDKVLEILSCLPKGYSIHLYGNGCRKIIKEKSNLFVNSVLVDNGVVSHEQCDEAIRNSNILINIGNRVTNQLPSKVFEYISYGKPIINFYFHEDDIGLHYLKRYPLCYNLNLSKYTQYDIKQLVIFCEKNKQTTLSFEQATELLKEYRAENVIRAFLSELV